MFIAVLIIIALLSIALSIFSLKNLSTKKEVVDVKNKLKKGRVVFQSSGSSSGK